MIRLAAGYRNLASMQKPSDEDLNKELDKLKAGIPGFFKDYDQPTDKKLFTAMLDHFRSSVREDQLPGVYENIDKKYDGDIGAYADMVYNESVFVSQDRLESFLQDYSAKKSKKLAGDPVYELMMSLYNKYLTGYADHYQMLMTSQDSLQRMLEGIMEKDNPDIYDYRVPERLKELYRAKDYGRYGDNGTMNVCFTAANHTTGGNSGSPVLNADGELIGLNFDRNWEGTMSDIMYNPDMCRNIVLDIRYCLFVIDKYAGAGHLVEEMSLAD